MPVGTLAQNQSAVVVGGPQVYNGLTWWQLDGNKWVAESVNGKPLVVPTDDLFARCIAFVFESEGGLSEDPNDKGGTTKFGISQRAYPNVDIKNLTRQQAELIYRSDTGTQAGPMRSRGHCA